MINFKRGDLINLSKGVQGCLVKVDNIRLDSRGDVICEGCPNYRLEKGKETCFTILKKSEKGVILEVFKINSHVVCSVFCSSNIQTFLYQVLEKDIQLCKKTSKSV